VEHLEICQIQNKIRTSVEGFAQDSVRELRYSDRVFHLELGHHFEEDQADELCSQFSINGSCIGEGSPESCYALQS